MNRTLYVVYTVEHGFEEEAFLTLDRVHAYAFTTLSPLLAYKGKKLHVVELNILMNTTTDVATLDL